MDSGILRKEVGGEGDGRKRGGARERRREGGRLSIEKSHRGLNNYPYYFKGSLVYLYYNIHQDPILIIQAPTLVL